MGGDELATSPGSPPTESLLMGGGTSGAAQSSIHLSWRVNHYVGEDSRLEVLLLVALVVV